jgi:hypothetical protein
VLEPDEGSTDDPDECEAVSDESDEFDPPDAVPDDDDGDDDASEVVDRPSSATAIPGLLAIAAPIPSATANAPILPTNRP